VPGTETLLPEQWGWWRRLYDAARRLFELYGYGEIRTPVIEYAQLFVKGTGETTDIVEKQMFAMDGGNGNTVTLRPEGTPPTIRAYLESGLHKQDRFQKFYYIGPMFRKERPQKGRLRQFHQIGVEAIGGASPLLDAETLLLATEIYSSVGLKGFTTSLNSIGCEECRPAFRNAVYQQLRERRQELCEDCQRRLDRNVFRILDCRNEACRDVADELPPVTDHLCPGCALHYESLKGVLAQAGLDYEEDPHLVRGLDYYTKTVYEIKHGGIGARDTICGGGRYDNLVKQLGGPPIPCVGFAIGVEASVLAMEAELGPAPGTGLQPAVYAVCFEDAARAEAFRLVRVLREAGIGAEMDYEERSAKAQMRRASKLKCPICVLLGKRELETDQVCIKEMATGDQRYVPAGNLVEDVKKILNSIVAEPDGSAPE